MYFTTGAYSRDDNMVHCRLDWRLYASFMVISSQGYLLEETCVYKTLLAREPPRTGYGFGLKTHEKLMADRIKAINDSSTTVDRYVVMFPHRNIICYSSVKIMIN